MWNRTEHDFGDVQENVILTTTFEFNGKKKIETIEPKCSCTNFIFDNNVLHITWKIKVKRQDRLASTYLTVVYADQSITDLNLTANVQYTR